MKNFEHKVRRFREFFTTKGSLNLLSYLPFPSSNTKKDKSLSKLPRCSPHLAGPLKPSATLTSILRDLSSAPPPLFLRLSTIFSPLSIETKALNLEIHHGISSRLRFRDPSACLRVGKIEDFCFVSQKKEKRKCRWYEEKKFYSLGLAKRRGERMGPRIKSLEDESFVSLDLCASFERLTAHRLSNFDPDPNVYFLAFLPPPFSSLRCFTLELFSCSWEAIRRWGYLSRVDDQLDVNWKLRGVERWIFVVSLF